MPRGKKTVQNYAPEMLELFQHGCKVPIEIPFATAQQAATFGYRMNRLRMAMRDEEHWLLTSAEGCSVSIDKENKKVTIKPVDMTFVPRIREALARLPEISKEVEKQEHSSMTEHKIIMETDQRALLDKFMKGDEND